jgi:Protein of unknown function (DUF664)
VTVERVIPWPEAGERQMLAAWLDLQRATPAMKCDGLTDTQLRDQAVPPPAAGRDRTGCSDAILGS